VVGLPRRCSTNSGTYRKPASSSPARSCRTSPKLSEPFARQDYAKAVELIEPHMVEHERIGGSRAQRRLIELTLDAARAVN
jgi:hypothetical protein